MSARTKRPGPGAGQALTEAPKKTLVMAGKLQARTAGVKAPGAKPPVTLPDAPAAKREDAKEKILRAFKRLHPME